MSINLMQIIGMLRNGQNPEQLVLSLLQQQSQDNPFFQNLLELVKNKDSKSIENIARNIAKERGVNFDQAFNSFKSNLGL